MDTRPDEPPRSVRDAGIAVPDFSGYVPLTVETVPDRLAEYPEVAKRLGGAPVDWSVREVGDGNLNFVYIVEGPAGSVCAKQALPYVRLVGEAWPLPLDRAVYEHAALVREAEDAGPGIVPDIVRFDGAQALIVMENLAGHVIWRGALIAGKRHATAAPLLGRFCAETLFRSSDLALHPATKKREVAGFAGNHALCRISEDLIFTDPYHDHEMNPGNPGLADAIARMRADDEWRIAIQDWKLAFMTRTEALLHGDLHSGSVMVSPPGPDERVRIIDPEFAFYGPMGFDLGAVLANLWLNAAAQPGWGADRAEQQEWVLKQGDVFWDTFSEGFGALWRDRRTGEAMVDRVLGTASAAACDAFLSRVGIDALGFAGAKMARRVVGLAGVADLRDIPDPAARAACEARALRFAGRLVKEARSIATVAEATKLARDALRPKDGETA